jgi:hypothetical protein
VQLLLLLHAEVLLQDVPQLVARGLLQDILGTVTKKMRRQKKKPMAP